MTSQAAVPARSTGVSAGRLGALIVTALGVGGWGLFAFVIAFALAGGRRLMSSTTAFQFDWHVYAAGGLDLVERTLYRVPLEGLVMPVDQFKLPPMSALWAVPLLPLPIEIGGYVWQLLGAACLAAAVLLGTRLTVVPMPVRVTGIALGLLALHVGVVDGIVEGTNNYLVLALVAGFAAAHLDGRHRSAGILLGLAVATKIWPVALAVVLVRERSWSTMRWTAGTLAVQGVAFLAWLGPDVVPHLLDALRLEVSTVTCCGLIGPAALREAYAWWPHWGGAVLALAFLAAPATGRTGIGLGILAGLMMIANLWLHYLPTALLAVVLVAADRWSGLAAWATAPRRWWAHG